MIPTKMFYTSYSLTMNQTVKGTFVYQAYTQLRKHRNCTAQNNVEM